MIQATINQRLKILIEKVSPNAKVFSETIEESPATTHNYIGKRQTEPRAQYLSKVLSHFADVSARWLMTGEGEAFTSDVSMIIQPQQNNQKKNKGNIVGAITGDNHTFNTLADCAKENEHLRTQVALLNSQLADKQEIIDLLKKSK